jgi:DDE superfamily endonuclease
MGCCEQQTGIVPFGRLIEQVMTAEPYSKARRVFWIVDNGSSHRGQVAAERLQTEWPNLVLVHLPFYASWLNQIEIVFSVIQRKVLTPQRLHQPAGRRRPARRLRAALQPDRRAVRMAVHPPRPRSAHRTCRRSRAATQARRLIATGLTTATTKSPASPRAGACCPANSDLADAAGAPLARPSRCLETPGGRSICVNSSGQKCLPERRRSGSVVGVVSAPS